MNSNKTIILIVIFVIILVGIALIIPDGRKGGSGGGGNGSGGGGVIDEERGEWEVISVSGAKCGNGEQYVMGFSPGPDTIDGKRNNRLVIWMPGGGSTMVTREGGFTTNVDFALGLISPPKSFSDDNNFIFLNHEDNEGFVEDAHWVILPYCTQDFHSGQLIESIEYDFTSERGMVETYERLLNQNRLNLEQVETRYPFVRVETREENGEIVIDKLYIKIIHHGAINVEKSLEKTFELLRERNFDLQNAEVIMAGSSAGGFGTWYNAWRVGDLLYEYPNVKFTIIPQSGSPSTMRWDGEDIKVDSEQIANVDYRLSYYNNINPCNIDGGNYNGGGVCRDTIELIEHYQQRWPQMDLAIVPIGNKEDLVLVGGLGGENEPGFDAALLNLCQTIHRYSQYNSKIENVFPYTLWQYKQAGNREVRVHGLTNSLLTVPMVSPNGQQADEYGILRLINDVASRRLDWEDYRPHIEHTLNVVTNPDAKESSLIKRPGYLPECNVPWPEDDRP